MSRQPPPPLLGDLARVGERLAALLEARDAGDHGIVARPLEGAAARDPDTRLDRAAELFGLSPFEVDVLLLAVAADLDARFGDAFAYLQDEAQRRWPSVGVVLDVLGVDAADPTARSLLGPGGALRRWGLLSCDGPDRPLVDRTLRPSDRLVAHLLGDDTCPPSLRPFIDDGRDLHPVTETVRVLADSVTAGTWFAHLRDGPGSAARDLAVAALARAGIPSLVVDLHLIPAQTDPVVVATELVREAALRGTALVAGPLEVLAAASGPEVVGVFASAPIPVVVHDRRPWVPEWSTKLPLLLEADPLDGEQLAAVWEGALAHVPGDGLDQYARRFRLAPGAIGRAVDGAMAQASAMGAVEVTPAHLSVAVRALHGPRLDRLARRVLPRAGFDDLVVRPEIEAQLRSIVARARHRALVQDEWRMGALTDRGQGTGALLTGPPGTGKTLSAEVIASELDLELYAIDLSTVVDKYIGETEKNLDVVFSAAEGVNAVLLFDEADALFGKRSDVKDAHDRYANVEVAYLLQRIERFDGIALLTTNLPGNVDPAFARRFAFIVTFDVPGPDERLRIWQRHLPPSLPTDGELDLWFLAKTFEVAGGTIQNVAVGAAYAAAEDGTPVTMAHLVRNVRSELRKVGRLVNEAEFGPYAGLIAP